MTSFQIYRVLRYGSQGDDVKKLQTALNQLGYNAGVADGIFGSKTRAAVISFQTKNGLVADGIVGPKTEAALNSALSTPTLLKLGSRGTAVKKLQQDLQQLGYSPGTADGIFGPQTQQAVMNFQKDYGLAVDGIVGPNTRKVLNQALQPTDLRDKIVATAYSLVGTPYVWGGESLDEGGFDCSGLVFYIFTMKYGIKLPRVASQQYLVGSPVSTDNLLPGDLVFYDINDDGSIGHVGIYVGGGDFISATSTQGTIDYPLSNPYWAPRYMGARRVL